MSGYFFSERAPNRRAVSLLLALCLFAGAGLAEEADSRGKQLYEAACTQCHGTGAIEVVRDGRVGWKKTVHKMVSAGAQLNVEEMELVIDYLAANFGPGAGPMKTGLLPPDAPLQTDGTVTSDAIELPEGRGKELVQGLCHVCHDLGRVVSTTRTLEDWRRYATQMLARGDMTISEEQLQTLVSYLYENLGTGATE